MPNDFKDCQTISIAYDDMRRSGFSHKKTPGRRHERKEKKPQTRLSILIIYTISASVKQQDYPFDPLMESQYYDAVFPCIVFSAHTWFPPLDRGED